MKNTIRLIAVILVIAAVALTAACGSSSKQEPTYATGTDSEEAQSAQQPTEASEAASLTEAPTEAPDEDEPSGESADSDAAYKAELVDHHWNLSAVYKDGEAQNIGVTYGSIIRQTGAYIEFSDDDTFQCVLGLPGCKGDYSVENGEVTLHITTKYDGSDEGKDCDENEPLDWDHEAGALSFDFNDLTNVFTKRD